MAWRMAGSRTGAAPSPASTRPRPSIASRASRRPARGGSASIAVAAVAAAAAQAEIRQLPSGEPIVLGLGRLPQRRHPRLEVGKAGLERLSLLPDPRPRLGAAAMAPLEDRKSTRLNSSHVRISYAV